jgi:hypothetical protein
VTSVIIREECSVLMEKISDFRAWVSSPFCLVFVMCLKEFFG